LAYRGIYYLMPLVVATVLLGAHEIQQMISKSKTINGV
jgi:hypothetical protein